MSGVHPDEDAEYSPEQPPSLNGVYARSRQSLSVNKPEAVQSEPRSPSEAPSPVPLEEMDGRLRSITNQLAETAVGVREMSKQLVRARVHSNIESVLIITKARDNQLVKLTREMAIWLMTMQRNDKGRGLIVYVDSQLRRSKRFDAEKIREEHPEVFEPIRPHRRSHGDQAQSAHEGQLRYWTADLCSMSPHLFDFVITVRASTHPARRRWHRALLFVALPEQRASGDSVFAGITGILDSVRYRELQRVPDISTAKWCAPQYAYAVPCDGLRTYFWLIQRAIPHSDPGASRYLRKAIKSSDTGEIIMRNILEDGWRAIEIAPTARDTPCDTFGSRPHKDKPVHCFGTRPVESFEILNDLVVDRGPSPFVSMLEVFADNNHLTTAQADGLCISTPTGSTAYSLSAGGSLVYPDIPAILITPICPHTLSFRPMLLPDSMELRIAVPYHSRSNAWASFDGRGRIEIKRGDHIKVTASPYPFPTVYPEDQPNPWFDSVSRTLNWNQRQKQKSFVMVEENVQSYVQKTDSERHNEQDRPRPESPSDPDFSESESDPEITEDFDIDEQSTSTSISRTNTWDKSLSETNPSANTSMQREVFAAVQPMTSMTASTQPNSDASSTPHDTFTPDRFGSAGPPDAPPPLSRRHLAAVDFRLQDSLNSGGGHQTCTHRALESGNRDPNDSLCSQAIVVYGHDDTDESESSDA